MDPYRMIIEEITVDGQGVSLGRCHRSTVTRWAKKVNDLLASDNASWRVKANYKACSAGHRSPRHAEARLRQYGMPGL